MLVLNSGKKPHMINHMIFHIENHIIKGRLERNEANPFTDTV